MWWIKWSSQYLISIPRLAIVLWFDRQCDTGQSRWSQIVRRRSTAHAYWWPFQCSRHLRQGRVWGKLEWSSMHFSRLNMHGRNYDLTSVWLAKKMVRQLMIVLSILLSSLMQPYPHVHGQETVIATRTECLQNVTFLHFIPCWRENDGIHRSALDRLDSCDLLARAAVDLAIERVNENREIFASSQHVRTLPLFPETNGTINVSQSTDKI